MTSNKPDFTPRKSIANVLISGPIVCLASTQLLSKLPVISLDSLRHTPPPCPARSDRPRPCRRTPATGFFGAPVAVSSVGPDATSHHVRRHRRATLPFTASLRPILRQSMTAPRLLSPFCRWACVPAPRALCYIPRLLQLAALPPPPTQPPPLHDCPSVVNAATSPTVLSILRGPASHPFSPTRQQTSTTAPHL
ncbi:hypothetical protein DFH08DRAFT_946195 [Mycena albidolilacea]|uniref:Uncharacterized protein n=1 Tax=Mycena albidolilacea TaxID=1033008 RepID=A0AAD6YXY7_9AGAR|nr:hypothetical protein DFH08DRAFT_946195 [Mycena albidolilacea]